MKLLYIDLFCGAGGTSTGVNNLGRYKGKKMKLSYEILVYNFPDQKTLFD